MSMTVRIRNLPPVASWSCTKSIAHTSFEREGGVRSARKAASCDASASCYAISGPMRHRPARPGRQRLIRPKTLASDEGTLGLTAWRCGLYLILEEFSGLRSPIRLNALKITIILGCEANG